MRRLATAILLITLAGCEAGQTVDQPVPQRVVLPGLVGGAGAGNGGWLASRNDGSQAVGPPPIRTGVSWERIVDRRWTSQGRVREYLRSETISDR